MDRGAWKAAVYGVTEGWTQLSDFTFTFHFHALEKEMATHSSVLAWRIPGTGEPGGLPSMGSHRVGHNWSDLAAARISCWSDYFIHSFYVYIVVFRIFETQAVLMVKNPPANAGDIRDADLILGSGRSLGGRHGNPLQYSCLENPIDSGAWGIVHSITKSLTWLKWLSTHMFNLINTLSTRLTIPILCTY